MRAPGRLVVLSLLLAAAPVRARTWPDCLHSGPKKSTPATLAALRACQKKTRRRLVDQAEARGKPLSDAELDALGDHQREEARRFLARPGAVVADPSAPAEDSASQSPSDEAGGSAPARRKDMVYSNDMSAGASADAPPAMRDAANAIRQRYKKAGLKRVPPDDLADFKAALEKSGGVMTPALDRLVDDRISAAQAAAPAPGDDKPSDSDPNANPDDPGAR